MILHLVDHFERHDKFMEFMKNNDFLEVDAYQSMVTNIEKFERGDGKAQNGKSISLKQVCNHFTDLDGNGAKALTPGCVELV